MPDWEFEHLRHLPQSKAVIKGMLENDNVVFEGSITRCYLVISFLNADTMKGMGLGIMLLFPKVQLPLSDETEFMFKVIETSLTILQICCMPDKLFSIYLKERDQMMKTMEDLFDIFKCSYSTEYIKTFHATVHPLIPQFSPKILIFQPFFSNHFNRFKQFHDFLGSKWIS